MKQMNLIDLHAKPIGYKFNAKEIEFIKSKIPKKSFKAKYGIYKPKSYKGLYIGFFIDSEPWATRRSGILNHWNFISERTLSDVEYNEMIENFGTNNRRFIAWYYKYVEQLIQEDLKYEIETPKSFIDKCKSLGFSGGVQTVIEFV